MSVHVQGMEKIPLDLRGKTLEELKLQELNAIVHLAGKAHEMQPIPEWIYFKVNFELTRDLADAAKSAGVRHFVYISSTKVYGEEINSTLNESSPCHPADPYGASKRQAEEYLLSIADEHFHVAIVRPPLVYGPRVKGNMIRLMDLAGNGLPLPLGNAGNQRSMVFLDNLIALIHRILEKKASGVFVGGDAAPVSTDELIRMIRKAMAKPVSLFPLPTFMRKLVKAARPALYQRLFGSFVVDNSATREALAFTPPFSTMEGIMNMVQWYQMPDRN